MKNNLVGLVVAVVCTIVVIGTVLMPATDEILVTAGDEITMTNASTIVLREIESGDVLECTSVYDTDTSSRTDTWTLNDEEITTLSGSTATWNVGLMSDGLYLQINASTNSAVGVFYDVASETPTARTMTGATSSNTERTFTFTVGDSTIVSTNSLNTTTYSFDYTWGYVICPYDDGEYCAAVSGGVGYVSNADEVILCGSYTSGDFDTMYYYKDGVSYVSNSSYSMVANIDTEITDGTTDIYTATISVDVSDGTDTETFTPYRILIPYEVSGHASSGALYSLYSIIPVFLIMAVLLGVTYAVTRNRD